MDLIIVVAANPNHTLPDLSQVFAKELDNILAKLRFFKQSDFDLMMDSGYAIVYYAIKMNIEYQRQGDGTVPENIVNEIWNQVLKGAKSVYKVCEYEEFNIRVTSIYYNKIKEDFIVPETLNFWKKYKF